MNEINVYVEPEPEISVTVAVDERKTQTKDCTPTKEAQTVTPDAGYLLDAVNVTAIPPEYIIPEGTKNIAQNGNVDVTEFATAHVAVPPPSLQQKTVTPTEQQQTVEADGGYDALSRVTVERIPSEYIVPSGTLDITENANGINVTDKATVNVAVPVPVMPDEYAIGGSIVDGSVKEYHIKDDVETIDSLHLKQLPLLEYVEMPNSIRIIKTQAFSQDVKLKITDLPSSLETIEDYAFFACAAITHLTFHSVPTTLTSRAFSSTANLQNIYVPWSEGAVANAPWGAVNATIHYNYSGS